MKWLDRRIAAPGPHLRLCLTEEDFVRTMRHCKVKSAPRWITTPQAQATTHHLYSDEGGLICVVCIRDWNEHSGIEIAGLLVHEAVHVWQEYADQIGEDTPGREQEAYAVQAIAQELMNEFSRVAVRGGE